MNVALCRRALNVLDNGRSVALATVLRTAGSAPRHAGASMLVLEDGTTVDSIGGGRVERAVVEAAISAANNLPTQRQIHHLTRDHAMCCGGSMDVYIEPLAQSRAALVELITLIAARQSVQLVTALDGSPKSVEPSPLRQRTPYFDDRGFVEPIAPPCRLVLFGAGHIAQALGPLAAGVGFEVVLCDDGEAVPMECPGWAAVAVESFEVADVEAELGVLGEDDFAIIFTREHAIDLRILERLLPKTKLRYLGMIGSARKVERFQRRLEAKGIAAPDRWERLHSPIGLPIGAETPAEIAISVLAELIRTRAERQVAY